MVVSANKFIKFVRNSLIVIIISSESKTRSCQSLVVSKMILIDLTILLQPLLFRKLTFFSLTVKQCINVWFWSSESNEIHDGCFMWFTCEMRHQFPLLILSLTTFHFWLVTIAIQPMNTLPCHSQDHQKIDCKQSGRLHLLKQSTSDVETLCTKRLKTSILTLLTWEMRKG